jgi:hypothetical protein
VVDLSESSGDKACFEANDISVLILLMFEYPLTGDDISVAWVPDKPPGFVLDE